MKTARVVLTIEYDEAAWNAEYGDEETSGDIIESLRMTALDSTREALAHLIRAEAVGNISRADWVS